MTDMIMEIGSGVRRNLFWLADRILLHGEYRKIYGETEEAFIEGTDKQEVDKKIQSLLMHAVNTTNFYSKFSGGGYKLELDNFPIVNKADYQEKWDDFVSTKYKGIKCKSHATSGSTGMPLEILYDQRKGRKRYGTSIFLLTLADYNIGDKQAYARVWSESYKNGFLARKAKNLIQVETTYLDKEHLEEICNILAKEHVSALAGHANALAELSNFIRDYNIDCSKFKVKSITPGSEGMASEIRKELMKQFSCPVCQIYGAEEFGTIGIQMRDSDEYYIDTSGVFIEVFKLEEDIPAEDGELGRLVITDLYNYAFPIIRYENGDIVVSKKVELSNGKYKQYFTEIYGRKMDLIYATDGRPISPMLLGNKMQACVQRGITQWKFIQLGEKSYRFVIIKKSQTIDEQYIRELILDDIGRDAEISFQYVDEIPVLRSGKRKFVENQWHR